MSKPKKAKLASRIKENENCSWKVQTLGTLPEWVISEPFLKMVDGKIYSDVVLAEDENGKYYTVMNLVRSSLMDPYRLYRRDFFGTVPEENTESL